MSSNLMRAECRKFTPNIFNKTKCTNCFRQKEEHTAEALESNRAARKISKCGYLFVAPGWDFSNPINRTKRWQRRWFVLYDDGELSYSLDEHPDTVPQASIDMNKVGEVTDAEEMTGNAFSIAITTSDGVHFVKGTCREEAKWWKDVLSVYPRSKGRHKRNATFPGTQTSSLLQQASLSCRSSHESRPRFNSVHTDTAVRLQTPSPQWLPVEDEIYPTRDITITVDRTDGKAPSETKTDYSSDSHSDTGKSYRNHHQGSSFSPPTRDKVISEERVKARKMLSREKRNIKLEKEMFREHGNDERFRDEVAPLGSNPRINQDITNIIMDGTSNKNDVARRLIFESEKSKREEKLKDIADSLTKPRPRRRVQKELTSMERRSLNQIKPTRDGECSDEEKGLDANDTTSESGKNEIVRGDPDGCGLDLSLHRYSPSSELRVDLPAEDLLNIKKGWLLKQGSGKEWAKHWFVLRGVALMYYRDPNAEDKGILDGVMDLSSVNNVVDIQVQRNYGFQAMCWDDKRYVLSAATAGIRSNWMAAIRKAAGLIEPFDMPSMNLSEKPKREADVTRLEGKNSPAYFDSSHSSSRNTYLDSGSQRNGGSSQFTDSSRLQVAQFDNSPNLSLNITRSPSCQFVERYLRKSPSGHFVERSGVKRSSSAQSLLPDFYKAQTEGEYRMLNSKESETWNKGPTPLPPSPPLNRTPISKVKERAKSQTTRSRVYNKRSKSSPPSSRKNTMDVGTSDETTTYEEKRDESIKRSTILDKVDRHVKEIDELKGQLSLALCERSTAEKELSRLKQRKSEANQQVEELLRSLKLAEDELKSKTQELENFENLKQRYSALVQEHEGMLKSWRESAINDGWREMYQRLKDEYVGDKESWEMKLADVTSMLHVATERCDMLARELSSSEETVEALKAELTNLSERLMRGLEENEGLYGRMRELEGRCLSSSRERGRSVDSLSDLTNIDLDIDLDTLDKERIIEEYEELKGRFEKAIQEIRAMKKELRESHANYDDLELTVINLRQDSKRREETGKAQAALMASRIEDLTLKLSASEKQSRLLKQKATKSESREKRRSLSLKGKESFTIGKETEEKLAELEAKINALQSGNSTSSIVIKTAAPPAEKENSKDLKRSRLRRKSLESVAGSEPMRILVRMFSLERKIAKAAKSLDNRFSDSQSEENEFHEESEDMSKVAEKLQECKLMLASTKAGGQTSALKALSTLETRLSELEGLVSRCAIQRPDTPKSEVGHCGSSEEFVINKFENLLKSKIAELRNRREQLLKNNELTEEAKLKLTAEKLAYESVLIKKIREAVEESCGDGQIWSKRVELSEIQEMKALIVLIIRKINGEKINVMGNTMNGLSKTMAETLHLEGELMENCTKGVKTLLESSEATADYDGLLEHQRTMVTMVDAYKRRKLEEIASSLALETLHTPEENEKTRKSDSKDDRRIREAWSLAQEALNHELTQTEISHIAMRCLLMSESRMGKEQEGRLTLLAEKYKRQEDYLQNVEELLRHLIDRSVNELTNEYEKALKNLRTKKVVKNTENQKEESKKYKKAMEDLFSVLVQMTIVNARISTLVNGSRTDVLDASKQRPVVRGVSLKSHLTDLDLETRFIYFYQKFSAECLQMTGRAEFYTKDMAAVVKALDTSAEQVKSLREVLRLPESTTESPDSTIQEKCARLSGELEKILSSTRGEFFCRQCCLLQEALHSVENRYDEQIGIIKLCHEKEMKDLRGELESQKNSLVCQHEQEQAQLMERTRRLEKRLGSLDAEYSQQMDNLRTAYHKTISAELGGKEESTEDSIRQRYQAEIEHLRTLCEKGLSAVDNSHRRIIAELEEKHRQELAAAAAEKEQALAEETQATLAALDAMRKAHETEVQKEINKFKAEFLKKMQSNHDIGALHKEHQAEMDEIKKEILFLSEKYSVKCVESASLEEQLSHVSKQLSQAQEHIVQLNARNKQLRAHLMSGTEDSVD
ncbi:hypothetical protein RUM44_008655 [Polyplax serrata]|uniref:PH domain-containing protein n=1 Tax=Polyplax serrata TaxID=468196 RepID=A0ABR1B8U9_POLSC